MEFVELKDIIPSDVVVWLQDSNGDCIDNGELGYLSGSYDKMHVLRIYPERYPSISSRGITVELE